MEAPVFYDPSGRRRRWSKRILLGLIILLVGVAFGFGATILDVPAPDPLKIGLERKRLMAYHAPSRVDLANLTQNKQRRSH